jgi:hypothetical protein
MRLEYIDVSFDVPSFEGQPESAPKPMTDDFKIFHEMSLTLSFSVR